jgi:hypothetical protein
MSVPWEEAGRCDLSEVKSRTGHRWAPQGRKKNEPNILGKKKVVFKRDSHATTVPI